MAVVCFQKPEVVISQPRIEISHGDLLLSRATIVYKNKHQFNLHMQGWTDNRLVWNASDFGNLTYTFVHASKIWTPNLLLDNR